jgi:putative two-component system response regulator
MLKVILSLPSDNGTPLEGCNDVNAVPISIERCLIAVERQRSAAVLAHSNAVAFLCDALSRSMGLDAGFVADLRYAARLHDIGKVAIPDAILSKPGPLDASELDVMRQHPKFGFDILNESDDPRVRMAASVALRHHERWDGSGYPDGLVRDAIPLEARIVSVCDVYHALREPRPYKLQLSHVEALSIVLEGSKSGRTLPSNFDPNVLAAFRSHSNLLRDAYERCLG